MSLKDLEPQSMYSVTVCVCALVFPLMQRLIRVAQVKHENRSSGFPTTSDTNWAVQPQKIARGLKFWI